MTAVAAAASSEEETHCCIRNKPGGIFFGMPDRRQQWIAFVLEFYISLSRAGREGVYARARLLFPDVARMGNAADCL